MKNKIEFPIIAIAFALGAFLPYIGLSGKIAEMNSKMDDMMEYVNSTNDRIDYIHIVERAQKDTSVIPGYASNGWHQNLFSLAVVNNENPEQVSQQFKSAN